MPRQKRKSKLRPKTPSRVKKRRPAKQRPRSLQHPELWGDTQEQISQRQKEIVAATWNEIRDTTKSPADVAEEARFLAETQRKLGEQAKTLAQRMQSRDLTGNSSFAEYMKNMNEASSEMSNAVGQLKGQRWRDALAPEQKALQGLLRADAQFRDIQVAFGNQNGGMGGGAGRDLASMLDLELDTSKNQYDGPTGRFQISRRNSSSRRWTG